MADPTVYSLKGEPSGAVAAFKDVSAAIQRTEDTTQKLSEKMEKLSDKVQSAVVNSSKMADTSAKVAGGMGDQSKNASWLTANLTKVAEGYSLTQLTGAAMATMGAAQVIGFFKNSVGAALEYTASLQDMSDQLGIGTDDLQIFGAWAEMSGTDLGSLAKAIAKLEVTLAGGSTELRRWGVTSTDGKTAFLQVVAAVEAAPSQFEKARIAQAAFGKNWAELMPVLNAGKTALSEIADNTMIIDSEDIQRVAKLDDAMARLASNTRAFAAELLGAFGPLVTDALDFWAGKLKQFNEWKNSETDEHFYKRIGATQAQKGSGGRGTTNTVGKNVDFKNMTSTDIMRLINEAHEPTNSSIQWDPETKKSLSSTLTNKQAEEAKKREDELAEKARKTKEENARLQADEDADRRKKDAEKRLESELQFQAELYDQIEAQRASSEQRELIQIRQKYDNLIAAHAGYSDSILNIEIARELEIQNYHLNQNFKRLAEERDADLLVESDSQNEWKTRQDAADSGFLGANRKTYASYLAQNPSGIEEDSATAEAERSKKSIREIEKMTAAIKDVEKAWVSMINTAAGMASSELAPALWNVFARGHSMVDEMGDALGEMVRNATMQLIELGIQFALITAATGGAFSGAAFMKFAFGGHADGTLSSPGGIRYLGENGPEPYETPYGQRGIASYGLYHVPAGTRVDKSGSQQGETKQYHLHTTEADPIQVGEVFRRVIREEIALRYSSTYRERTDW